VKFAIINDTHVSSADTGYENGIQRKLVGLSESLVKDFVSEMNLTEKPAFVVHLGDLIEDVGDKDKDMHYLRKTVKLLSGLKMQVHYLIGNHDIKTNSADEVAQTFGYKKMYYSWDYDDYHFVALSFERDVDEKSSAFHTTHLSPDETKWLKDDLAKTKKSTVIFSHYGLADDDMVGNFWFENIPDRAVLNDRGKIRKIFEDSGKVKGVISAHQHWNRMFVHGGIPYITVTSLVENFHNDGEAAEAHTIVNLDESSISVAVRGNDPANYKFEFDEQEINGDKNDIR
jgi:predicted phosphodiesterase